MTAGAKINVAPPGGGSGSENGIGELTGDVTTPAATAPDQSVAATLAASGVTAGIYGDATDVPVLTIDAKGRVTDASTLPVSGGAPGTTVENFAANATPVSAATATNLASVVLTAGTWLVIARVCFYVSATPSVWAAWLGPNSASAAGAYVTGQQYANFVMAGGDTSQVTLSKSITVASTTTVYLEMECPAAGTASPPGGYGGNVDASGITAVRTA